MSRSDELSKKSRFLSFLLRHKPEAAGLVLNKDGWTDVSVLVKNTNITKADLDEIVQTDEKGRYSFSEDSIYIRANQGHSLSYIKLKLKSAYPPSVLFHGTTDLVLKKILKEGLKPMRRQHVHLSVDRKTAEAVGKRHKGKPVVLIIDAHQMILDGHKFYFSDNGIWLIETVLPSYIKEHYE